MTIDLDYQFEWDEKYCYPNSHVLKNKLNITDADSFKITEREITSVIMQEILEYPVEGNFNFTHLKRIHKILFEDIFTWAGEVRSVDIRKAAIFVQVNILKTLLWFFSINSKKNNFY